MCGIRAVKSTHCKSIIYLTTVFSCMESSDFLKAFLFKAGVLPRTCKSVSKKTNPQKNPLGAMSQEAIAKDYLQYMTAIDVI